jgi:UDP-N-acetylglucosamine--N-acetylmuramyl-(pentapeptide) pyrophosphoryl-undecaprenol N-acetylglucosamine transferase
VPGLHLLSHFQRIGAAPERVVWFLTGRAVEQQVLGGSGEMPEEIRALALERVTLALEPAGGGAPSLARVALRLLPETLRARRALRRARADVLLGLGGFTSLPAALAARSLGIPFALLEINAAAGRATRALTPLAARVFHAWPDTAPSDDDAKHRVTGPPLAPEYLAAPADDAEAAEARAHLGFDPARPLLLVLGGSQGAGALNDFVRARRDALLGAGLQVVHQVGPGRLAEGAAPARGYLPVEYLRPVHLALRAATVVLCRGGASTIAEVGASGRAAVVVPYPHSPDRHQEKNAARLGDGALVVAEAELGDATLARLVELASEAGSPERRRRAAAAAAAVPRDAGERIARELLALARPHTGLPLSL